MCTPVNFDVAGPRLNAKVTPGGEALTNPLRCDSAPAPHARGLSVRANDPTSRDSARGHLDEVGADRHNGPPPQELHAASLRTCDEALVQRGTPHSNAKARRKISRDARVPLSETDSPKIHAVRGADGNTEIAKGGDRFRHHPFAAGFFNGRRRAVGQDYVESLLARCDRRSEARGAAADHKYVGRAC